MMKVIPEGLKTNFQMHSPTGFADVLKPVFGSLDNLYCEFRIHKEFSNAESKLAGKEVQREMEVLMIQTDRFSRVPLKVGDPAKGIVGELTPEMQFKTAELYERFKTQKDSTDTLIYHWEAVSDMEKGQLASLGIYTVEQLHKMPEADIFRLGPGGKDLWERAGRHVATKKENDVGESRRELELVMDENRRIREKQEHSEKRYFEMQAQLAKVEARQRAPRNRTRSRPKRSVEQEQLREAA